MKHHKSHKSNSQVLNSFYLPLFVCYQILYAFNIDQIVNKGLNKDYPMDISFKDPKRLIYIRTVLWSNLESWSKDN